MRPPFRPFILPWHLILLSVRWLSCAALSVKPKGDTASPLPPKPPPQASKTLHTTACLWLAPYSGAGFWQDRRPVWGVTCSHTLGALGVLGPVLQEADCRGLLHPHTDNLQIQCPAKPRSGSWAGMGAESRVRASRYPNMRMSSEGLSKLHPHFQPFISSAQCLI